jgi:hypothetical protein
LLQRALSRRKEAWRAEFRAEFLELVGAGRDAQEIERMPSTRSHWRINGELFDSVTELMRRNDDYTTPTNAYARASGMRRPAFVGSCGAFDNRRPNYQHCGAGRLTYEGRFG